MILDNKFTDADTSEAKPPESRQRRLFEKLSESVKQGILESSKWTFDDWQRYYDQHNIDDCDACDEDE